MAPVVASYLSFYLQVGEWRTWLPALELARREGLKVTLHLGEVGSSVYPTCMAHTAGLGRGLHPGHAPLDSSAWGLA